MTFDEFLDRHLVSLARYARAISPDRPSSEDALSDALLAAHTRWHSIATMEYPVAYVRTMINSRIASTRRTWYARRVTPVDSTALAELHPDSADHADSVSTSQAIQQALMRLPPRQRAAVVLRYLLDMPFEDIAQELKISAPSARSAVSRAMHTLRTADSLVVTPEGEPQA